MLKLIKGGEVYAPQKTGVRDILLAGKQILAIGENLAAPAGLETETVDAAGKIVIPGYIDTHMHLLGGGGGNGPMSRSHEIDVSTLAKAGITTVCGTLGINTVSFSLRHMMMTLLSLEMHGISSYMYTGGYQFPAVTLMDSVMSDIALIEKVVGVKIALFDVLGSHPSNEALKELASKVCLGGRLGGKPAQIHAHLGETEGRLKDVADLLISMGLPTSILVATHVNRSEKVLKMSVEAGLEGVMLDITALYTPDNDLPESIYPATAYKRLRDANVPVENLTMSSDGNAVQPIRDENGVIVRYDLTSAAACAIEVKKAVMRDMIPLEDILPLVTTNAAKRLGVDGSKGSIAPGKDADIVFLDKNLEVDTVFAKGKLMLKDKAPVVAGWFEEQYASISV